MTLGDPGRRGAVSVSELTFALKGHVESRFSNVRVFGEVLSARAVQSGHLYFTLKDREAQLPVVVWRSTLARLPLRISDGMQVIVVGDLQIYPPHGRYQLVARSVLDMGAGLLLARLEELKQRLAAEGLFDPARKRPLPLIPRRIGIVTAETGAAVHDILTTLRRRYPADVVLAPCRVQGPGAAREIAAALHAVAQVPGVDVVIVGRGGGSLEDLWAFNEEVLVRAIAASPVPVVSAVGHEIDQPLSDLAADARAATPTAAGELVVPQLSELRAQIAARLARLAHQAQRHQQVARTRLNAARARLGDPRRVVAERQQAVDEQLMRLDHAMSRALAQQRERLTGARAHLRHLHPRETVTAARVRAAALGERLDRAVRALLVTRRGALTHARRTLTVLSPTASLERGYAIVRRPDGLVVRDARQVDIGAHVEVILHAGALDATVAARRERNAYEPEET